MYSVQDITQVIISDLPNTNYGKKDPERYMPGEIILGVSKDNQVHYEWFEGIMTKQKDNVLLLDNYQGKILVPKNCGLQILNSNRPISGLVNYPTYLDSYGDINIMIYKDSGLELLVSTVGEVMLNGKYIPKIVEGASEEEIQKIPTIIGEDFTNYEDRYTKKNEMKAPQIIREEYGAIADFGNKERYSLVQVCMKYNLVVIDNDTGNANIYYENYTPYEEKPEFNILKGIRTLKYKLENAKKSEEYENVIKIQRKLEKLYSIKEQLTKNGGSISEKTKAEDGNQRR